MGDHKPRWEQGTVEDYVEKRRSWVCKVTEFKVLCRARVYSFILSEGDIYILKSLLKMNNT